MSRGSKCCRVSNCDTALPAKIAGRIFCKKHWDMVPVTLKEDYRRAIALNIKTIELQKQMIHALNTKSKRKG